MITHLTIKDPTKTGMSHWPTIPALAHLGRLDFGPGMTVIVGPNGSGKSSILKAITHKLHCEQGGDIRVTSTSLRVDTSGVEVDHDGRVIYVAPERRVGIIGSSLDDDFFNEGVAESVSKCSSGQHVTRRLMKGLRVLGAYDEVAPPRHMVRVPPELEKYLNGTLPKTVPTVIFDEPDISLELPKQYGFFQNMATRFANQCQIIVTTHSPFALNLPGVTYVDLVPGYLKECRDIMKLASIAAF